MNRLVISDDMKDVALKNIDEILHLIGISDRLKGYTYLQDAILEQFKYPCSIMKLYDFVAKKHQIRSESIERAIRYAIEKAYEEDEIRLNNFFEYEVYKPSNSEVIAMVAEEIRIYFLQQKIAME